MLNYVRTMEDSSDHIAIADALDDIRSDARGFAHILAMATEAASNGFVIETETTRLYSDIAFLIADGLDGVAHALKDAPEIHDDAGDE